MPTIDAKNGAGTVKEEDWDNPHTMYGCNKLYCEKLGIYYSKFYGQKHLDEKPPVMLDFRAIRFPGLISAFTLPSGGTSDYGPEMLHAAAQGIPYSCFVRPDTTLPFMVMPDAIKALVKLEEADVSKISQQVYNVTSFSLSAQQIYEIVMQAFPQAQITFEPDPRRQKIVDTWPEDVDDSAARADWGWQPDYDL